MKLTFNETKKKLEDASFERKHLGKETVKQCISPMGEYAEVPCNFQIIDWQERDKKELIQYSLANTQIGGILIANTSKGICFLGFTNNADINIEEDFRRRFPNHEFKQQSSDFQKLAIDYCNGNSKAIIPLHLKGTPFQISIWEKLIRIPEGKLSTYSALSGNPKSARAVGTAVGANPVSYIVPCHRIVRSDGSFHGYHWGTEIKKQLLAYELQNAPS